MDFWAGVGNTGSGTPEDGRVQSVCGSRPFLGQFQGPLSASCFYNVCAGLRRPCKTAGCAAGWPEDALEPMFEEFWRAGAPAVGEEGAAGWGEWISAAAAAGPAQPSAAVLEMQRQREAREEREWRRREDRERQQREEREAKERAAAGQGGPAGWSGWDEMAPAIRARFGHSLDTGGLAGQPGAEAASAEAAEAAAQAEPGAPPAAAVRQPSKAADLAALHAGCSRLLLGVVLPGRVHTARLCSKLQARARRAPARKRVGRKPRRARRRRRLWRRSQKKPRRSS